MLSLQQVKTSRAHFVERRILKMLSEPLESSGTLVYVAPDKLQKTTLRPKPERLTVDRDKLTIEGGPEEHSRTVSLQDYPEIGAFVESIRATLAGDLPGLSRFYALSLSGDAGSWQLLLAPKEKKLQEMVRFIRFSGSNNTIHKVETLEGDGDVSEMTIVEDSR